MNYIEEQAFEKLLELVKDRNWRLSSGFYLIESKPDNDPNAPGRITPFVMRKEQAEVLATRHTRNFRPKARKLGISTVLVLANGDECLWTPNLFAAVIDKSEGDAFGNAGQAAKHSCTNTGSKHSSKQATNSAKKAALGQHAEFEDLEAWDKAATLEPTTDE